MTGNALSRYLLLPVVVLWASTCEAHVLQHLSWFHVERNIEFLAAEIRISHTFKFQPERMKQNDPLMDTDSDSTASQHEIADFCMQAAKYLAQDFSVQLDGRLQQTRQESFLNFEDNSGFRSELVLPLPEFTTETVLLFADPAFLVPASVSGANQESSAEMVATGFTLTDTAGNSNTRLTLLPAVITTLRLTRASAAASSVTTTSKTSLSTP